MKGHPRLVALVCLHAALHTLSCAAPYEEEGEPIDIAAEAVAGPAEGTATTLDIASWNIEWFGDTANGPSNETLQLQNARDVISGADMDIWGVAEIVSTTQFNSLKSQLPGYSGFLANDAAVTGGSGSYSATEQKVGILYKSAVATLQSAKVILTANDYDFAGRPPLEVKLSVTLGGVTDNVVVIVLHAKATSDDPSWQRRQNASTALKSYLDTTYPTGKVFVVGDWNDDVDTSITPGRASPYQNFVSDSLDYTFVTKALTDAGISSTTGYPDLIDHHLITNDLNASYVSGSVKVYPAGSFIPSYGTTTSDHFPVFSRYNWGGGGGTPTVAVTAPNGGESFIGGTTQNITWTASGLTNVKLDYTLNDGLSWTAITASTAASAGTFSWLLPNQAATLARVRVSDTDGSPSDASNQTFTITTGGGPAQVILNEICVNEPGSDTAGEFIEIVNVGGTSASIGGWTLSDATSVRHTFAAGTTLAAGKAIAVFGGASAIPAGLTNALACSTGTLSLSNGSEQVCLKDGGGVVKNCFTYTSALSGTDGVSMNRSPDGSAGGTFALHTAVGAGSSSAGKRASGALW
ncbi:lamin tail domain-containing protein [Sorangium sp. So ce1128]